MLKLYFMKETFFRDAKEGTDEFKIWEKRKYVSDVKPVTISSLVEDSMDQKLTVIFHDSV